jgi:uncharacterized protein with GYD domain
VLLGFLIEFFFLSGTAILMLAFHQGKRIGGAAMPKYISLVNYTTKGIENIKESPHRLDAVKKLCESMNSKVDGFYLTMGRYDIVLIVDAPDAETVAKIVLAITSKGAVRTETLFAFPEKDYRRIISELP